MIASDELLAEFAAAAEEVVGGLMARESVRSEIAATGFSQEAWTVVAQTGWMSTLLDEADGGLGLGVDALAPIFRAGGKHLFPGPLLEHAVAAPLAAGAADGNARRRLIEATRGNRRLAVSIASSGAPHPTLEGTRLSGRCPVVRFAATAEDFLVAGVRSSGETPLVLVPRTQAGISITDLRSLDPAVVLSEVSFDRVSIEPGDVLGECRSGSSLTLATELTAALRLMTACTLAGLARHALDQSVAYARERHQFGKPIGSFQAVQHQLAEMARQTLTLESFCEDAARAGDHREAAITSLMIKAHSGRVARHVIEGALQVHGGIAFTLEHELHRYYKHALTLEALYGQPAELELEIGRCLLRTS